MFSRKTLFFVTAISLLAFSAKADTPACVSVDCAALGYTKTAAQCSGADTILKCPFDANKVACPLIVKTPILSIAQNLLLSVCHTEPIYTLGTDISSCTIANSSENQFCSYLNGLGGLKITSATCQAYLADNPSAYSSMKTTQDLVSIIENILLYVPCANSVSLDEFDICTRYCAYDNTKCMEKATMVCNRAIEKKGGIPLSSVPSNTAIFGEGKKFYLMNDITITKPITKLNSIFISAAELYPCASEVPASPMLQITGPVYNMVSSSFYVRAKLKGVNITGETGYITTSEDLQIGSIYFTSPTSSSELTIDATTGEEITVKIGLFCEINSCVTNIMDDYRYQNKYIWCGENNNRNEVYIDGHPCTSTDSSEYCYRSGICPF